MKLLGAVDGDIFDLVVIPAATVVACAGIPFGIFIGKDGARGFEDGGRDVVLAGDQFERGLLPLAFEADQLGDFGIGLGDGHGGILAAKITLG